MDDLLPVAPNGSLAFSRCKDDGRLWVQLVEKAYAKAFGCYEAIQGGYVHQALMDLAGGVGETLQLHDDEGRLALSEDAVWAALQSAWQSGALLGAGSNTGSNSQDEDGIVLGHAYAVIGLYEEQSSGLRLLRLRNPWGHGDWSGDWGLGSDKWTAFYRRALHQPEELDDGRFWMDFSHFLLLFETLFLCRLMPHRLTLDSAWRLHDGSAAGPKEPKGCPHFLLQSETDVTVHLELEQQTVTAKEAEAMQAQGLQQGLGENGYAFIQLYVLELQGQRAERISRSQVRGWANDGRLANERTVSTAMQLRAGTPYTLVLLHLPGRHRALLLALRAERAARRPHRHE